MSDSENNCVPPSVGRWAAIAEDSFAEVRFGFSLTSAVSLLTGLGRSGSRGLARHPVLLFGAACQVRGCELLFLPLQLSHHATSFVPVTLVGPSALVCSSSSNNER